MSFPLGVAVVTPIAGSKTGIFTADLTTPGQWPQQVGIGKITNVSVWAGDIIDSVRFTYSSGKVVQHGGNGGSEVKNIPIAANQKIVAVYGRSLTQSGFYGPHNLVQLTFMVATSGVGSDGGAQCTPFTADSKFLKQFSNVQFDFEWSLEGAVSYTAKQTPSQNNVYLQGLGFTEVFSPVP